ncbi:DUF3649 domain-containing protein [Massilia dura]|uniref:DUF3649 domain-containing protein n=1 Tax=Pseudoduganella dura TaxID=321982 RepID=A0A6I3XKT8_9BURK|nr:DUF3649 domain-containing protein [Pseudoduganella dura]MUI13822.1 DUF3649 domain-containing protein [Pseudoduganella dura]GGY10873.1 hypothetical protein GCM10007386_46450 [Pseudoduganella dura]
MSKKTSLPAAYRWLVASRSVAAIFGGYLLAAAWAACMSLWLQKTGMARVDAVTTATMSSFVVHLCAAIWVFAAGTTQRAWIGIVLPAALLAAGTWLAGAGAGGAA